MKRYYLSVLLFIIVTSVIFNSCNKQHTDKPEVVLDTLEVIEEQPDPISMDSVANSVFYTYYIELRKNDWRTRGYIQFHKNYQFFMNMHVWNVGWVKTYGEWIDLGNHRVQLISNGPFGTKIMHILSNDKIQIGSKIFER